MKALPSACSRSKHRAATAGRPWTLSIAVPGSVIDNTQNMELATFVAGQIARAAAIFNVDEVRPRPLSWARAAACTDGYMSWAVNDTTDDLVSQIDLRSI